MPRASWKADSDGTYWIDISLGARELSMMVDLGMVDAKHRVGFSIEADLYDELQQAGEFSHVFQDFRLDASGAITARDNGRIDAQLIEPASRQRIGPPASLYVSRGSARVPNRVGTVFFHHLPGCHVSWDLDQRVWSIDYP